LADNLIYPTFAANMHPRNLLFTILLLLPILTFAQAQDPGIRLIDSLEAQLTKLPDDRDIKAALLTEIGTTYRAKGSYPKAIEYYMRAYPLFEARGNKNAAARTAGNIGSTYLQMASASPATESGSLYKAIEYLDRSVAMAHDNGYTDIWQTFDKDLKVAVRMLGAVEAPVSASGNEASVDSLHIKMANTGIQAAEEAKKENSGRARWYYIGGIAALVILLVSVLLAMYLTYKKQKVANEMISKEKHKAEELLLNILPEQAAAELKSKGMVHPQQFDDVTVIITDFVGFTTAAEKFSPKQLVGELHTIFKAFDGMLEKYKIEKIKTIGDAYLAIAGVPVRDADHAANAVALAIKMRDYMLYRKSQLGEATFQMRIGVHSGSVVAGIVGSKKFAYDIWGDTVNMAARMEQNSIAGKINISQSTYELVKSRFHCEFRGEIEAKNKGRVAMYYVLDEL